VCNSWTTDNTLTLISIIASIILSASLICITVRLGKKSNRIQEDSIYASERIALVKLIWEITSEVNNTGHANAQINANLNKPSEARIVFNDKIFLFVKELFEKAQLMITLDKASEQREEIKQWFKQFKTINDLLYHFRPFF
jgi:hypothetical protein